MSKTDVKETGGNIQNKLKNKEMSRNIISDYMLGLQARADTSSADIIADIINPQQPVHTRSSASHSYGQVLHIVHTTENVELTFLFAHPMVDSLTPLGVRALQRKLNLLLTLFWYPFFHMCLPALPASSCTSLCRPKYSALFFKFTFFSYLQ